ncbi:ABC transporter permease [Prochlorococcus sp. AH-736-K15]|nr:ABC transporter permease [Prochlorococcus sp. AH-736-K15]
MKKRLSSQSIWQDNMDNKYQFKKYGRELKNFWKLGWQDNKARYSKTYLGEIWIAISVVLLASILGAIYGDIFGSIDDKEVKYFSYLAIGITLWNSIADAMSIGSRFIFDNSEMILNTNYTLRSLYIRKFSYVLQNLIIGLSAILSFVAIFNFELVSNFLNIIFPFFAFVLFNFLILIIFSIIGCIIRDFAELVPLLTTIIFLSSPILYPASKLEQYSWIATYNIPYRMLDLVRRSVLTGEFGIIKTLSILILEFFLVLVSLYLADKYRYKIALWCD